MSKITLTTIKSFIKKNQTNLFIKHLTSSNELDSFKPLVDTFNKVQIDPDSAITRSLGVLGAHFSSSSKYQYLTSYSDDSFYGYKVSNFAGSFIIAVSLNPTNTVSNLTIDTSVENTLMLSKKQNYEQFPYFFQQYRKQIIDQVEKAFGFGKVCFVNVIKIADQHYAMFNQFATENRDSYWFACPVTLS